MIQNVVDNVEGGFVLKHFKEGDLVRAVSNSVYSWPHGDEEVYVYAGETDVVHVPLRDGSFITRNDFSVLRYNGDGQAPSEFNLDSRYFVLVRAAEEKKV